MRASLPVLGALLLIPAWAVASPGMVEKATKSVDRYHSGEREALVDAWSDLDPAMAHRKVADDGGAWARRGRVAMLLLTNPDLLRPEVDLPVAAIESFKRATTLRVVGLEESVVGLESALVASRVHAVEGKRFDEAAVTLELALRSRALAQQVGSRDPIREAQVRGLAVQIAVVTDDLDRARTHFDAMVAAGETDLGLAIWVARRLGDAGEPDAGRALLAPLRAASPDDERLLRAETDLLVSAGHSEVAAGVIDAAYPALSQSVSGAFLAADLFRQAGDPDRARSAWEAVLVLDLRHRSSLVALGASLVDAGVVAQAELRALEDGEQSLDASVESFNAARDLDDLWARAELTLARAKGIDSLDSGVPAAQVRLLELKWAGCELHTLGPRQRSDFDADQATLAAARQALAEGATR